MYITVAKFEWHHSNILPKPFAASSIFKQKLNILNERSFKQSAILTHLQGPFSICKHILFQRNFKEQINTCCGKIVYCESCDKTNKV